MWTATVITNDPLVGTNPERDTFYGFHPNPGYDDWFGYFYGDFRGTPGDRSGWVALLHENYPDHYHWNVARNGWAVHGHAKQYIAYYNWTFGGECGLGRYGSTSPPPYMADQYGYPVVDIYVDSVPPPAPQPRVSLVTASSVTFTWDPVADRGDGAGVDYFASGTDHYTSWLTINGRTQALQLLSTSQPRAIAQQGMSPLDVACVHVQAFDRVQNASPEQVACSKARGAPPMPGWIVVLAEPHPASCGNARSGRGDRLCDHGYPDVRRVGFRRRRPRRLHGCGELWAAIPGAVVHHARIRGTQPGRIPGRSVSALCADVDGSNRRTARGTLSDGYIAGGRDTTPIPG
jgi:hypothetical protein